MKRPTIHTVHLHAFWAGPGDECASFCCPVCRQPMEVHRPAHVPPAAALHYFQSCPSCGVPTSLTVQGYVPNPTGDAPAPSVPQGLRRAAEAPAADRTPPQASPAVASSPGESARTLKAWRRTTLLDDTWLQGLRPKAISQLYCNIRGHWPDTSDDGKFIYLADELEEIEAWLKTRFNQ
jgi:hypothetical protein